MTSTTINDVVQWLDDSCHDDQSRMSPERGSESHAAVLLRTARQLADEAHIDGLSYGSDWSEWLAAVDFNAVSEFMDGKKSQITPDAAN